MKRVSNRRNEMHLDRPLDEILRGKLTPYSFEVGILHDGPHYAPLDGKPKQYAGGKARRQSRSLINGSLSSVSRDVRRHLGFNYLTRPFKKKHSDIVRFTHQFFKMAFGTGKVAKRKRCENLLQAVVRNPILRGDYGRNSRLTAKIKGFNRKLIDTAQFFKSIAARVRTRRPHV